MLCNVHIRFCMAVQCYSPHGVNSHGLLGTYCVTGTSGHHAPYGAYAAVQSLSVDHMN